MRTDQEIMYAWCNLAQVPLGDHTWVTTYSPGSGLPNPSQGFYWPCYGDPRPVAKQIAKGRGGIDFAQNIADPFDKSATAGIRYGVDGVCHQIANRLLRFSFDDDGNPIRVSAAKGYRLSVIVWGEYGERKNLDCRQKWDAIVNSYISAEKERS